MIGNIGEQASKPRGSSWELELGKWLIQPAVSRWACPWPALTGVDMGCSGTWPWTGSGRGRGRGRGREHFTSSLLFHHTAQAEVLQRSDINGGSAPPLARRSPLSEGAQGNPPCWRCWRHYPAPVERKVFIACLGTDIFFSRKVNPDFQSSALKLTFWNTNVL